MAGRPKLIGDKDRLIPAELRDAVLEYLETATPPWIRIGILLADQAGLRASEIVKLQVQDCRLERAPYDLLIRGAKHRAAGHVDPQLIGPELRDALAAWFRAPCDPDDYVLTRSSSPYSRQHLHRVAMRVHEACQVPEIFNLHSWRHGYGTRVYRDTKDLVFTQRMLRHRSTGPTERYVHMADTDDRVGKVLGRIGSRSNGKQKSTKRPQRRRRSR